MQLWSRRSRAVPRAAAAAATATTAATAATAACRAAAAANNGCTFATCAIAAAAGTGDGLPGRLGAKECLDLLVVDDGRRAGGRERSPQRETQ